LPATVPTHFDMKGNPNDWNSKSFFLYFTIGLSVFAYLMYLFLRNAYRIDPKRNSIENKGRLEKIAFAVLLFLTVIQLWIIHITERGTSGSMPRAIFAAVGILLAVIGNYMDNIKPNYFAGLRLPWTLENEDNWRKTHHYASRLWFGGGLVIAVCSLLLPVTPALIILFTAMLIMVLLPTVYSYRLYKKNKQNFS
jgi:uncharacterized membrane protein